MPTKRETPPRPRDKKRNPQMAKRPTTGTSTRRKKDTVDLGQLILAFPGTATPMGLRFDAGLPYRQWAPVGIQLRRIKDWSQFALGDWLEFGEGAHGELYAQAADETGILPETLAVLKHVAGAIPENIRRIDKLHWSHHRLVAPRKYDLDEKRKWLGLAIENKWGVRAMAEAMRAANAIDDPAKDESEGDETEAISGGCEVCGNVDAAMRCCGVCAAAAAAALGHVAEKVANA